MTTPPLPNPRHPTPNTRHPSLMLQGTASSVGKSLLVTALCRLFRQAGWRVAPFKAQNMSNNAAVTPDGAEIGRAQAAQAEAAGIEPTAAMNPILLKPESDGRSQVIVMGRPHATLDGRDYFERRRTLTPIVEAALRSLRLDYDLVLIEGAGSPAEINLKHADLANMTTARLAEAPVLLVGDINPGGVFASLVGTLALLEPDERDRVAGFIINKFRGDRRLLQPGLDWLEQRTGKPVLGVIPYLQDHGIADEDAVALEGVDGAPPLTPDQLDVAVVRLPRIANFDDFDPLREEPGVHLRWVTHPSDLTGFPPDLLILPGTKTTIADLEWLQRRGLVTAVRALAAAGVPVLGICGGYQMLGRRISDPDSVESPRAAIDGLGLLPLTTVFRAPKTTRRVVGHVGPNGAGWLGAATGATFGGYEIHAGEVEANAPPAFQLNQPLAGLRPEGAVSADGLIVGTSIHGCLTSDALRGALLGWLAQRRGWSDFTATRRRARDERYDRLANHVGRHLDLDRLAQIAGLPQFTPTVANARPGSSMVAATAAAGAD